MKLSSNSCANFLTKFPFNMISKLCFDFLITSLGWLSTHFGRTIKIKDEDTGKL